MSNAMRMGKRSLAGVAAGALGLALIPFVGVGTSSAAAYTGTTSPVRVTYSGTTLDKVPYAAIAWSGRYQAEDTAILSLSSAPTGTAKVAIADTQVTSPNGPTFTSVYDVSDFAQLGVNSDETTIAAFDLGDDSAIYVAADTAGAYAGTLTFADGDTVPFSFTTTGAATNFSYTINSSSVPQSSTNSDFSTIVVLDAGGQATQLQSVDRITLSTTETGAAWDDTVVSGVDLFLSTKDNDLGTAAVTGTYTATATPGGTSWSSTAKSGTYTVIDNVAATGFGMVDSSTLLNQTSVVAASAGKGIVSPTATTLNFALQVSTSGPDNRGKPVVVTCGGTAFTGLGLTCDSQVVQTSASTGQGTFSIAVPAAGAIAGATVTVVAGNGTYTATYTVGTVECNTVSRTPSANVVALVDGTTQNVTLTVDDSYGVPKANYTAVATSGTNNVVGVTDAQGQATLALPDVSGTGSTATWTLKVTSPTNTTTGPSCASTSSGLYDLRLDYTSTGTVTITSPQTKVTTAGKVDAADNTLKPVVPYEGTIGKNDSATSNVGRLAVLSATVGVANVNVEFTAPEGVWFCTDDTQTLGSSTDFDCTEKAGTYTASTNTISAYVTATKTGSHTITATTTSGATTSWDLTFVNEDAAARDLTIAASPAKVSVGASSAVTVAVTDVFGNAVPMTTGGATVTLVTDHGTLAGGTNIYVIDTTTTGGTATVSATAATAAVATITATGSGGQFEDEANDPYVGVTASVYQAAVPVEFTSAPTEKAIVIEGDRGTVSGQPGIIFVGETTGFDTGAKMKPWIRFPGQTEYSAGSARPETNSSGVFNWQRKTGKKTYVYFTNEDDAVKSNRVTIPAK